MDSDKTTSSKLEVIRDSIKEMHSGIDDLTLIAIKKLADRLDLINEDLNLEKIGSNIERYNGAIFNLIDSNHYTEKLHEQTFAGLVPLFKQDNEEIYGSLDEQEQKKIENIFVNILGPLNKQFKLLASLSNQERLSVEIENDEATLKEEFEKLNAEDEKRNKIEKYKILHPDPRTFEFSPNISTPARLAAIYGVEIENIKTPLANALNEINAAIKAQDHHIFIENKNSEQRIVYQDLRKKIEGKLPLPRSLEIDFSSSESVQQVSYLSLALMLGVNANESKGSLKDIEFLKNESQEKLLKAGIEKENVAAFLENLRILIQIRLELDLVNEIKLDDLDEKRLNVYIQNLEEREKWLKTIVRKGVHEDLSKQKLPEDKNAIEQQMERRGVKIRDGVWAQMAKDGSVHCLITNFNDENIAAVVKQLGSGDRIQWHHVPSKFKQAAEIETLRSWKRVFFDKGKNPKETALSKLMPETPGSWAKWLDNINNREKDLWAKGSNEKLKANLIQKVVGTDEKRLNEFWQDLANNSDHKEIADTYQYLTKEQRGIIENSFNAQITNLKERRDGLAIPSLNDDTSRIELNRCKIEISGLEKSAQTFGSTAGINPGYLLGKPKSKSASDSELEEIVIEGRNLQGPS